MSLSKDYIRGYNAGLKMASHKDYESGYSEGRDTANRILKNDLIIIHGILCIVLQRRGWKQKSIEDLITQIQREWVEVYNERTADLDKNGHNIPFAQYVFERTGIELVQGLDIDIDENGKAVIGEKC